MNNNATANVTANEILSSLSTTAPASPYAANAMRPALIRKSIDGRTKAIDADFAGSCGVSVERLHDWSANVDAVYDAACAYSVAIGNEDEAEKREALAKRWAFLVKAGEEDALHPNIVIRDKDTENLRVLAAESTHEFVKGIGFVPTNRGKLQFRGLIEIRLAMRIAGNATLSDDERETVTNYQQATKIVKQTRDLLIGSTRGDVDIPSIYEKIDEAQEEFDALTDAPDKVVNRYNRLIDDLKKQATAAETRLDKYLKVRKELREKYQAIVARLEAIEDGHDKSMSVKVAGTATERKAAILAKVNAEDLED